MRGKTVIAGVGHTAFGKHPGRGTLSLNAEAIRTALEDARIEKSLVDALFVKVPTSRYEMMYGQNLAEAIGVVGDNDVGMLHLRGSLDLAIESLDDVQVGQAVLADQFQSDNLA